MLRRRSSFPASNFTSSLGSTTSCFRFCSSSSSSSLTTNSSTNNSSIDSSSSVIPQQSFEISSRISSIRNDPRHQALRNERLSPSDPAGVTQDNVPHRIAKSFKKATSVDLPQDRFPRKQDDSSLYHDISPENLGFVYQAERDEMAQEEDAIANKFYRRNNNNITDDDDEQTTANNNNNSFFEQDTPYFSTAMETTGYVGREGIHRTTSQAFLGREGDQIRQKMKKEELDALHPERNGDEIATTTKIFASKKVNKALSTERALQQLIDSSAAEEHKAAVAVEVTASLFKHNLPIRPRLVEETFGLWHRVTQQKLIDADTKIAEQIREQKLLQDEEELLLESRQNRKEKEKMNKKDATEKEQDEGEEGDVEFEEDHNNTNNNDDGTLSSFETSPIVETFFQPMSSLYFHMRKQFTAPTPAIIEYFMTTLQIASNNSPSREMQEVADRLMLDMDQYTVLPTRITFATYFDICALNGKMDIALVRLADAKDTLHLDIDSGMVRSMVAGLVKNGMTSEALAFLARTRAVQVDVTFMNSILELLSLSPQPMAAFAAFRALETSSIRPNSTTCYHLLRACQASGHWDEGIPIVLANMQKLKIKGDDTTLNLLLKGLVLTSNTHGYGKYAHQLYFAMKQKNIEVFEEIEASLPEKIQARGEKLQRSHIMKKRDLRFDKEGNLITAEEAAQKLIDENNKRLMMSGGDFDDTTTNENNRNYSMMDERRKRMQEQKDEALLRELAAENRLAPKMVTPKEDKNSGGGGHHDPNNNNTMAMMRKIPIGGAPLIVMCRFGLRKVLGTYEDQDQMRKYLLLKRRQYGEQKKKEHLQFYREFDQKETDNSTSHKNNENDNKMVRLDATQRRLDSLNDEVMRIAKILKPKMWRYVHKHFYGVLPVSTQVVDMTNRKRRDYVQKIKLRQEKRKRRSETS